jgi:hypothetical protein
MTVVFLLHLCMALHFVFLLAFDACSSVIMNNYVLTLGVLLLIQLGSCPISVVYGQVHNVATLDCFVV